MEEFLMRAGWPYRMYCYITSCLIGFELVMPGQPFYSLAVPWGIYTAIFTAVLARRRGVFFALATCTFALVVVAVIKAHSVYYLCLDVWLACIALTIAPGILLGFARLLRRFWNRPRKRKQGDQLVQIVARNATSADVNAASVLEQFGLGPNSDT
jgi:hypothetical protein